MARSELTIDLGALRRNVRRLLDALDGAELWAVVKANGYGHGAADCAVAALEAGATALCVATVGEALALRRTLPDARILVLGPTAASEVAAARDARLELTVSGGEIPDGVAVHVKLETGMGRWGVSELPAPARSVVGVMTHLATADSDLEFARAQIVLLGNGAGAGGRYRIGHALMADMLDMDGVYGAIRNAGLELPERPRAEDLQGRLVAMFIKCEPNRNAKLKGRRQVMFNDSDVPYHRHAKAAVGGAVTAAIGDPAVFISVDAMHSGPHGSGPVAAIVDVGP